MKYRSTITLHSVGAPHDPKNPNSLAHNQVRALLEDSQGNFWVGTGGDGLHLMNREKGTFTRLTYDSRTTGTGSANSDKLSIPRLRRATFAAQLRESHVSSIFEDGQGRIWITAVQGGLNVFDPKSGAVWHFETGSGEGSLTTNFLWQTFQSADGTIWIATGNGGATIIKIARQGKRIPFFLPTHSNPGAGASDAVKDKAGNVWIGYGNNPASPLIRYDRKTGKEFPIPGSNPAPDGLNARIINTLMPDREGFLWVGTENGLFRHDPLTGKFRHFTYPPGESTWVGNLLQDRNGYIWTYHWRNGLNRLDRQTGKFTCYRHDPADPGSIGGNLVSGLWEDAEGALWVGGGSRNDLNFPFFLDRFNPPVLGAADAGGQNLFTHFIKEKEAGTAEYLTGDDRGKLWFLAFGGIQKFDPVTGDRQKFSP
ncbi:MAG: two-component regulator propeller domain-containing protein, partial [Bacteroidota bacterium]